MRIEAIVDEISRGRTALLAAADECPPAHRTRSLGPDRWSVRDVLDHVDLTQTLILRMLTILLKRAQRSQSLPEREIDDVPITTEYASRVTSYTDAPAYPSTEPRGREEERIRESLNGFAARLEPLLDAARSYDCSSLTAAHPIGTLNYYEWLLLLAQHDHQHARQIRDITRDL